MFLTTKLGRMIAGAGALLLALLTFGASQRRKGAQKAKDRMNERDHKEADRIRRDVRDAGRVSDVVTKYRD